MAGQQTTDKPRRHTDAELLRQLEADPDGGMGAIMAQFTAPLWHAARSHLENPEDIKECINDTFLDFYIHRAQFDPEKGALSTYLSRIVRNKAIDRYRRNQAHGSAPLPEDLQDPTSPTEQVELRQDLEQALNRLSPEDAELLRMRYFMEMTVQEIADRLGLPYETVKKRSQRSLSRLKKILLGLLLVGALAVLAACAYAVLRWFGIVPGYGATLTPEANAFVLEEPRLLENENGSFQLLDAMLLNDELHFLIDFHPSQAFQDSAAQDLWMGNTPIPVSLNGENAGALLMGISSDGGGWLLSLHTGYVEDQPSWGGTLEAAFTLLGQDVSCRLVQVEAGQVSDYAYQIGDRGGLLAAPRLKNGRLIVGIYPLNTGEATLLTNLLRGVSMEGKRGDVTVTGPDGQELVGEPVHEAVMDVGRYYYDWDFGPAPPGAYTLHVPYVYLTLPLETPVTFQLDLEAGTWTTQAQPVPGGTLLIESCQPLELSMDERSFMGPFLASEGVRFWNLRLRYTPEEDLTMTACFPGPAPEMEVGRKYLEETVTIGADGTVYGASAGGLSLCVVNSQVQDNLVEQVITGWDGLYDPADVRLTISGSLSLRWEHPFDIPIAVEAES